MWVGLGSRPAAALLLLAGSLPFGEAAKLKSQTTMVIVS